MLRPVWLLAARFSCSPGRARGKEGREGLFHRCPFCSWWTCPIVPQSANLWVSPLRLFRDFGEKTHQQSLSKPFIRSRSGFLRRLSSAILPDSPKSRKSPKTNAKPEGGRPRIHTRLGGEELDGSRWGAQCRSADVFLRCFSR
jgi:hypothetical protein